VQALEKLGYVDGRNTAIELRLAAGNLDRLPTLADDLVQHGIDIIFTSGTPATQAAKQSAGRIPIVFANVADPVSSGFVESLGRPGRNLTGMSLNVYELSAKRLQLLKEAFPKISRIAVVVAGESQVAAQFSEVERAARLFGMDTLSIHLEHRDNFARTFEALRKWGADSIYVTETSTNFLNRFLLAEFAAKVRLPAIFGTRDYAEAGGLMSYGASYTASSRLAAVIVDKILKGAQPGDIPVEQPTIFELVINIKTARSLEIRIPPSIMVRADKVID
jgi:putative ABC transport system substrate-binding protein